MSTYGLWLSAAGMKVNEHRQTLLANNMANASTPGFKHDLAAVLERRVESLASARGARFAHPVLDGLPGGLDVQPPRHSFAQGAIEPTGRSMDAAIEGEGFFTVSDGEKTCYTRDGAFTTNGAGEVVLAAGEGRWRLLDDAGRTIHVDETLGEPSVSQDSTIRQGRTAAAVIQLVVPEHVESLRKIGENVFEAPEDEDMAAARGRIVPESIEASNFEIMPGLASMIEASRAYQLNATMLQLQDQVTGQAVNTVGRLR